VALLTALSFNAKGNMSGEPVVGQNTSPTSSRAAWRSTASSPSLFQDATFRDYFLNETEVSLAA
jgi:hypothetical protein